MALGFGLFVLVARPFVVETVSIRAEGRSMRPGLHESDRLLAEKLTSRYLLPQRGDIIVFRAPPVASQAWPDRERYVKRVIGLPGDRVYADIDGRLVVNDQPLHEAYVAEPIGYLPFPGPNESFHGLNVRDGAIVVPEGELLVLGDNRNASYDSADWGFLPEDHVLGRVIGVLWPPSRAQLLERPDIGDPSP